MLACINILKRKEKKILRTNIDQFLCQADADLRNIKMLCFWGSSSIFMLQIIRSFVLLVSRFCCWGLGWRVREGKREGGRFHAHKSAIEDQTKAHLKTSSKELWPRLKTHWRSSFILNFGSSCALTALPPTQETDLETKIRQECSCAS